MGPFGVGFHKNSLFISRLRAPLAPPSHKNSPLKVAQGGLSRAVPHEERPGLLPAALAGGRLV